MRENMNLAPAPAERTELGELAWRAVARARATAPRSASAIRVELAKGVELDRLAGVDTRALGDPRLRRHGAHADERHHDNA